MRNEREWELSKKFSAFLDSRVYPEKYGAWSMERISDKARQTTHGDIMFSKNGTTAYVDEKAYSSVWDGCLIELLQDVGANAPGWFFTLTHCTHLICGYYKNPDDAEPCTIYKVSWPKLKKEYLRLFREERRADKLKHDGSARGYGLTVYAVVPWWQIKDCIELLWGKPAFIDAEDEDSKRAWDSTARKAGAA